MATLDSIIQLSITAVSATPTRANFGTPLILVYHTLNSDLVRTYTDPSEMVTDGFSDTGVGYLMATAICSQNPRPPSFKVGRLTASVAQTFTFLVTNNTAGDKVGFALVSPLGVTTDCYHTVTSQTVTEVATAVAALIDALPDITATNTSTATVTATASTAGLMWFPQGSVEDDTPDKINGGTWTDTTAAPATTPATDLAAIALVDNDWYTVSPQYIGATNIQNVAVWCEANEKIGCFTTADSNNLGSGTGIADTLKDAGYKRSYVQFSGAPIGYGALALASQRLTADPGSDTWAYKDLSGVVADDWLTPTQTTNLLANGGNYFQTISGIRVTVKGQSPQGQFMDIQRGLDALAADMQSRVWVLLTSNPKIPYTTKGVAAIGGEMLASLLSFTGTPSTPGFLSTDPGNEPQVLAPVFDDISTSDKTARILRGMKFSAVAQGAIQTVVIQGTITF